MILPIDQADGGRGHGLPHCCSLLLRSGISTSSSLSGNSSTGNSVGTPALEYDKDDEYCNPVLLVESVENVLLICGDMRNRSSLFCCWAWWLWLEWYFFRSLCLSNTMSYISSSRCSQYWLCGWSQQPWISHCIYRYHRWSFLIFTHQKNIPIEWHVFQLSNVLYVIWTLQDLWMDVSVCRAQKKYSKAIEHPSPLNYNKVNIPLIYYFNNYYKWHEINNQINEHLHLN